MTKNDAIQLWVHDRVLFDCGRHGFVEGEIVDISPSREFFKLKYDVFTNALEWFKVERIQERLPYQVEVFRKKGWFR